MHRVPLFIIVLELQTLIANIECVCRRYPTHCAVSGRDVADVTATASLEKKWLKVNIAKTEAIIS